MSQIAGNAAPTDDRGRDGSGHANSQYQAVCGQWTGQSKHGSTGGNILGIACGWRQRPLLVRLCN